MKNLFPAEEYVGQKKLSIPKKIEQRTSVENKRLSEKRRTWWAAVLYLMEFLLMLLLIVR